MAWAVIAMAIAGTAMAVGGQMSQAAATKRAGEQYAVNKEFEAAQMDVNANQALASSQRAMLSERERAALVASRALAVGGKSGGGLLDPTMAGILTDISGEGALRAGIALYEGEEKARQLRMGAAGARLEGQSGVAAMDARASGMRMQAYATLLSSGASMYGKYGMGGPKNDTSLGSGTWIDAGTPTYPTHA